MEATEKPAVRQVTYTAGTGDPIAVDWHGMRFVSGVPREVSDPAILDQVAGNPHFGVDGQDKAKERDEFAAAEAKARADEARVTLEREGAEMKARHDAERAALERRQQREADTYATKTQNDGVAATRGSREHDAAIARASSDRVGLYPTPSVDGAIAPNAKTVDNRSAKRDEIEKADAKNLPEDHVFTPDLAGRPSLGTPLVPAAKPLVPPPVKREG